MPPPGLPGIPPCPPWAPRGAARRVPGALDEVPGAPFGSGGPARTFSGALLPPRGGVVKTVVLPGNPVFGPGSAEKSSKTIVNMYVSGEMGFLGGSRQGR